MLSFVETHFYDEISQILMVPSSPAEARVKSAEGWNLEKMSFLECPLSSASHSLISLVIPSSGISHSLMVPSSLAVANNDSLKGEKSKSTTGPAWPRMSGVSASSLLKSKALTTASTPPPPDFHGIYIVKGKAYCCEDAVGTDEARLRGRVAQDQSFDALL